MLIGTNAAFALVIFGLLAIYWELIRPGWIFPLLLGAAGTLTGAYFIWRNSPTASGLELLAAAAGLFIAEATFPTRGTAGALATDALAVGAWRLFGGPGRLTPYLTFPLCFVFGAITIWLSAGAKRARWNKAICL
jgi:membrane-bound ClpP family serine protease